MIDIHEPSEEQPSLDDLRAALASELERELEVPVPPLPAAPPEPEPTLIEQDKRLSESIIWQWQREWYERMGPRAWSEGHVPHYVTTNSWMARAYAQLIQSWLLDLGQAGVTERVYIVEVAAGPGKLAFLTLQALEKRLADATNIPPYTWVLTDLAEANIASWNEHPQLQQWLTSGRLDTASFDLCKDTSLRLQHSKTVLDANNNANLLVVANYAFDSVPQDVFAVQKGKAHEQLISISLPAGIDSTSPNRLANMLWSHTIAKHKARPYTNAAWNQLVTDCAKAIDEGQFSFPNHVLAGLERLSAIANEQLVVLAADKGATATIADDRATRLTQHGSISMRVNLDAISRWFALQNGATGLPDGFTHSVAVTLYSTASAREHPMLWRTYRHDVAPDSPDTFYALKVGIERNFAHLSSNEIISYVYRAAGDSRATGKAVPWLIKQAPEIATAGIEHQVEQMLALAWEQYFHIGEAFDLAFHFGSLLYELDRYDSAIGYFEKSLSLYGDDAGTRCNMGMCYFQLNDWENANRELHKAIELKPGYQEAESLLAKIAASREAH